MRPARPSPSTTTAPGSSRPAIRPLTLVRQGLLEEVQALLAAGLPPTATAWQAIGYKQFLAAADGRCTVTEAIEEVKLRSRQYAKRQLTWLRRNPDIHWILWGEEPNFPQGLQNATEYLTALGLR